MARRVAKMRLCHSHLTRTAERRPPFSPEVLEFGGPRLRSMWLCVAESVLARDC